MITGASTFTVLITCSALLSAWSAALYVTVYVPSFFGSTVPAISSLFSISGSRLSVMSAPCSMYSAPYSRVISLSPFKVISGGVLSTYNISEVTAGAYFLPPKLPVFHALRSFIVTLIVPSPEIY